MTELSNKTEIMILENEYKLVLESNGLSYQLYEFDRGGNTFRNLQTGLVEETKPKWRGLGMYYRNVAIAVDAIAKKKANTFHGEISLKDYAKNLKNISDSLVAAVQG